MYGLEELPTEQVEELFLTNLGCYPHTDIRNLEHLIEELRYRRYFGEA